uniref:Uncharacterized protein n=1 Tax=Parascaris univalens TaxID=6257 RepID=A0A915BBL7_PARUN
ENKMPRCLRCQFIAFTSLIVIAFSHEALSLPSLVNEGAIKRNNPHWDDLGWSWGKRALRGSVTPQWENSAWILGERTFPSQEWHTQRALGVAMTKKNPDWHDLGWTWGRK